MSNTSHPRSVGGLVVTLGIWLAVMAHPGIAVADPTAEGDSDTSSVGSPAQGGPEAKTELGVVSSGGSTPSTGASSVEAGSGSDATSSGPDQASTALGSTAGSTEAYSEPAPGVVVRSSGGALTSGQAQGTEGGQHVEQAAPIRPAPAIRKPASSNANSSTEWARSAGSSPTAELGYLQAVRVAGQRMAEVTTVSAPQGRAGSDAVSGDVVPGMIADVETSPDATPSDAAPDASPPQDSESAVPPETDAPASARDTLQALGGFLADALAPLVLTLPGSPVKEPAMWAVIAWARREFERSSFQPPLGLTADPRQSALVADGIVPGAVIDGVDHVTGRVSGHFTVGAGSADLTYVLAEQLDRRLGAVAVDAATGRWTFTPNPTARLAAQMRHGGSAVAFAVAVSDGRTVGVSAPVDPAEAAVTGTIHVGDGLTYGLAAVGDRLCVLTGSDDAAGNGSVQIIDTPSRTVVGTVEVGSMPFALAVRGRSLYVGNADDGTVSVVDVAQGRVVDVIGVGANPFGLAVTGDRLYVADHSGTVSAIDLTDNHELARIPVAGRPFGVVATADRVYVTDYAGGTVAVVDQLTNTAVDAVAAYPYAAAVLGGRLYVANAATNALTVIDGPTTTVVDVAANARAVDAIPGGAAPVDMVVRGDRWYVGNVNSGTVTVLDAATNRPVETIGVGIQPGLITATPDGRTIYVADVMDGTVRVISSVRHAADG